MQDRRANSSVQSMEWDQEFAVVCVLRSVLPRRPELRAVGLVAAQAKVC